MDRRPFLRLVGTGASAAAVPPERVIAEAVSRTMEAHGVLLAPAVEGWHRITDNSSGHVPALDATRYVIKDRRVAGAAQVQRWLAEETGAIEALRRALSLIEE